MEVGDWPGVRRKYASDRWEAGLLGSAQDSEAAIFPRSQLTCYVPMYLCTFVPRHSSGGEATFASAPVANQPPNLRPTPAARHYYSSHSPSARLALTELGGLMIRSYHNLVRLQPTPPPPSTAISYQSNNRGLRFRPRSIESIHPPRLKLFAHLGLSLPWPYHPILATMNNKNWGDSQ